MKSVLQLLLALGCGGIGGILFFLALMARIDSPEEFRSVVVFDVLIGLLLGAGACLAADVIISPQVRSRTRLRLAIGGALSVVCASLLIAGQRYTIAARTRQARASMRNQQEEVLTGLRSVGLLDRARQDFANQIPNAMIEHWGVTYTDQSNRVWCVVQYRKPGGQEFLEQEFGYARSPGTNWSLSWGGHAQE